jgi:tryptophan synthase alpha chain
MSGRIAAAFATARAAGRAAFIPYLAAGDPDLATTQALVGALVRGGADIVELGVPFSDPIADGPVNQRAAERALRSGTTLSGILDLCAALRRQGGPPIVLFTYFNPIHRLGTAAFAERAAAAGVEGVLVTDLPPEEGIELHAVLAARGIDRIGLVAPTSTEARIDAIVAAASGFLYYISRTGVTGERAELPPGLERQVDGVRRRAGRLPIAVGFGISRPGQVAAVSRFADGVVVGSALVRAVEDGSGVAGLPDRIEALCRSLTGG